MHITSPVFENNSFIPQKYSCEGEGICPPLIISNVLDNTKSLALIVDDPDSIHGLFAHWIVFNISPQIKMLENSKLPEGAKEGVNGARNLGWISPCPPKNTGVHHYRFKLFALDALLDLPKGVTQEELEREITKYTIDKAELIGLYQNSQNKSSILTGFK